VYYCIWCSALVVLAVVVWSCVHCVKVIVLLQCGDRSLIINIGLVASCWFTSLHHAFHDARSQETKINKTHYNSYTVEDKQTNLGV